jgi:hypothetical protein
MTFALRSFPANGKAEHRQLLEITLAKTRLKVGAVTITVSVPKADVLVDGLSIGTSPLTDVVFLDPGSRLIEAKLDGYEPAARRLDLKAGSAAEVAFELTPSGTSTKGPYIPILVVGASVTGAALIAGTVLAVLAHGKASDAASNTATLTHPGVTSPCAQQASVCAAINSDLSTRDQLSDASMGLFIGAGVVGLATLGYGLLGRRSRPATGLRFLPAIGAKQAGAVLTGAW